MIEINQGLIRLGALGANPCDQQKEMDGKACAWLRSAVGEARICNAFSYWVSRGYRRVAITIRRAVTKSSTPASNPSPN